jgi:hypothetical protein
MAKDTKPKTPTPITVTLVALDGFPTVLGGVYEWLNEDGWIFIRQSTSPDFDSAYNMALLKEINFSA